MKEKFDYKRLGKTILPFAGAGILALAVFGNRGRNSVQDIEKLINEPTTQVERVGEKYADFKYKEEIPTIIYTAERVGVEPELLLAIRMSENGRDGLQFGIIPTDKYKEDKGIVENGKFREYKNKLEKQASWCAWTIRKNRERFGANQNRAGDFINYLQKVYCPVGAENDPKNLNENWERNVRFWHDRFTSNLTIVR